MAPESPPTETAPREETVWEQLTKERLEKFHSWLNRAVFNQIRFYKQWAELTIHPKKPKIKEDPSEPLSYEDRLKEYNSLYRTWQYVHAAQIPYWLFILQDQIEQNNDRVPLLDISAIAINTLLALHIAYNRRRVNRVIGLVQEKEKRRQRH